MFTATEEKRDNHLTFFWGGGNTYLLFTHSQLAFVCILFYLFVKWCVGMSMPWPKGLQGGFFCLWTIPSSPVWVCLICFHKQENCFFHKLQSESNFLCGHNNNLKGGAFVLPAHTYTNKTPNTQHIKSESARESSEFKTHNVEDSI